MIHSEVLKCRLGILVRSGVCEGNTILMGLNKHFA